MESVLLNQMWSSSYQHTKIISQYRGSRLAAVCATPYKLGMLSLVQQNYADVVAITKYKSELTSPARHRCRRRHTFWRTILALH